ncbi:MAG: hypothetical protein A4E72_01067 [Syntrophus sp. PtaU1.Bin208]|nr:MAG: hypothetical protein A4E72_01067 [Syntrophus sp. PtaU1.Bin208]
MKYNLCVKRVWLKVYIDQRIPLKTFYFQRRLQNQDFGKEHAEFSAINP